MTKKILLTSVKLEPANVLCLCLKNDWNNWCSSNCCSSMWDLSHYVRVLQFLKHTSVIHMASICFSNGLTCLLFSTREHRSLTNNTSLFFCLITSPFFSSTHFTPQECRNTRLLINDWSIDWLSFYNQRVFGAVLFLKEKDEVNHVTRMNDFYCSLQFYFPNVLLSKRSKQFKH